MASLTFFEENAESLVFFLELDSESQNGVYGALHPSFHTALAILKQVEKSEKSSKEISRNLGLSQNTVNQFLRLLVSVNLLDCQEESSISGGFPTKIYKLVKGVSVHV